MTPLETRERSFVGVGAFALFLFVLVAAVVTRAWRVSELVLHDADARTLLWLPLLIGRDLLLAAPFGVLPDLLRLTRLPRALVAAPFTVVAGAVVFWRLANVLSYHAIQGPITLARLLGGDGARVRDLNLLDMRDVWPVLALGVALLVVVPVVVVALSRRVRPRLRTTLVIAAVLVGAPLTVADVAVLHRYDSGLGDEPVWVFLVSALPGPSTHAPAKGAAPARATTSASTAAPPTLDELARARTPLLGRDPNGIVRGPGDGAGGPGTVKNVIVFFAEGIPRAYTSLGHNPRTTPNVLRRAQKSGLEFTRYYSPFHKSIEAIFSFVCSDYPPPSGTNIDAINPRIDCGELSQAVRPAGIHAGLFHGGEFAFYNKLGLLGNRGYEVEEDAPVLNRNEDWESNEWGVDDRAMVQGALDWIDGLPADDRFVATLISLAPHYPYMLPADIDSEFPANTEKDRYLSALHFLDEVFEKLMEGLEERGLADDTAVIFLADHGENIWEPLRASMGKRLAYDNNLHVPFVIFAPKLFPTRQVSARPGGHIDLVPTVLDLLGVPAMPQHRGQSLLSPDWQEKRIFFGAANGNDVYVGFMDGNDKIIVNHTTGRAERYDLASDAHELHDLAGDDPKGDAALTDDALLFFDEQTAHLAKAPDVVDDFDVERAFAEKAHVRVRRGESVDVCTPIDDDKDAAQSCPAEKEPVFLGKRMLRAAGATRGCLAVRVPDDGGALEMEIDDPSLLPLLTRLRLATGPMSLHPPGDVKVTAVVDDRDPAVKVFNWSRSFRSMLFKNAALHRFTLRVEGQPFDGVMCLMFSTAGWHGGL